ncbi:MAG: preprotein translocase subunit YajC [Alphaproteobacteria bacterium]|nr:preprotein translocase subunit YajC [Alphaproteobacteria bacterium]|tara:strand:- start:5554 stop:5841 length:288 start_codon:yes stop_codon:yes gene_type:complete
MNEAFVSFLPLILIFVIFYFLLIRPQQKKMKQHKEMIDKIKRGDDIVTAGGIFAKVSRVIDENKIEAQISSNVKIIISRPTITSVINNSTEANNK